ncbi:MAG: helix-hairpin-helix domain-containing protein [Rubrivivax sp.]
MRADLALLGIETLAQLAAEEPDALYAALQAKTGQRQDPCVWDVFAAAIHQARTGEARDWWTFTPQRKARQAAGRFPASPLLPEPPRAKPRKAGVIAAARGGRFLLAVTPNTRLDRPPRLNSPRCAARAPAGPAAFAPRAAHAAQQAHRRLDFVRQHAHQEQAAVQQCGAGEQTGRRGRGR